MDSPSFVKYRYVRYRFIRCRFRFVRLRDFQETLKSRRLQDMSSRHLQDVFNVTIFRLPRRLEDVLKTYLQDVFKTYRRLGRQKNCYAEDVFKTCLEDTFKMSWRPTNVYWVKTDLMKLILFLLCFYKFIKNVSRITLSYFECYSFTQ